MPTDRFGAGGVGVDIKQLKDQARGLEQQGKVAEALALYRQAIDQLDSTTLIIRELPLFVKVGDLCAKVGDAESAIRHYEQAAEYYADDGAVQSVVALCVKVLRVDMRRTIVYFRLARRMLDRGHVEPARAVLLDFAERSMQQKLLDSLKGAAGRPAPEVQAILLRVIEVGERSFKLREERRPAAGEPPRPAPAPTAAPSAQEIPSAPPSVPKPSQPPATAAPPPSAPSPASPSAEPLVIQFGAEYLTPAAADATAELHAPPMSIAPPPGSVSPTAPPVTEATPSVPTAAPPPAPPAPPPPPPPPPPPAAVVPPADEIPREPELIAAEPAPAPPSWEVPAPAPSEHQPVVEQPIVPTPAERGEPAVLVSVPTRPSPSAGRWVGIGVAVLVLGVVGLLVMRGRGAAPGTDVAVEAEEPGFAPVSEPLALEGQPAESVARLEEQPSAFSQDTVVAPQQETATTPAAPAPTPAPEPAAPAGFVLTQPTVVISGLPVENVAVVSPDAGGGYQVMQRLDSGDRVYVTVAPRGGPADTLLAGQIVVAPTDDGAVGQTVFSDYFVTIHGPVAVVVVESLLRRLAVAVPPE
ncbi:MAG TPA: hypothetical protein VNL18_05985 [Gemmatimonadales bacterium]|nr:hypothetical protein [Gemmatimonadales bacterium]